SGLEEIALTGMTFAEITCVGSADATTVLRKELSREELSREDLALKEATGIGSAAAKARAAKSRSRLACASSSTASASVSAPASEGSRTLTRCATEYSAATAPRMQALCRIFIVRVVPRRSTQVPKSQHVN